MWPTVKTKGEPVTAWADAQHVRQIPRNLFTNAQRYGGPLVEVRFASRPNTAVIVIADNGTPIEPSQVRRIFDPYTSAHKNGEHLGSIGLGLFIALKLARLMGGDLQYRHDGTYSLFELSLPLYQGSAAIGTHLTIGDKEPTYLTSTVRANQTTTACSTQTP